MNYQTVIFDFDGVLCRDRFYEKTLLPEHKEVYLWIQTNIFGNHDLVQNWMRGKVRWNDINKLISDNTDIDKEELDRLFVESVRKMDIDPQVKQLAQEIKKLGIKVAIITDNMDIFSEVTVDNHNLNKIFDVILNSADHNLLKKDDNGRLFEIALKGLKCDIKNSLLIDDSRSTIDFYRNKGGNSFHYQDYLGLQTWLATNPLYIIQPITTDYSGK